MGIEKEVLILIDKYRKTGRSAKELAEHLQCDANVIEQIFRILDKNPIETLSI